VLDDTAIHIPVRHTRRGGPPEHLLEGVEGDESLLGQFAGVEGLPARWFGLEGGVACRDAGGVDGCDLRPVIDGEAGEVDAAVLGAMGRAGSVKVAVGHRARVRNPALQRISHTATLTPDSGLALGADVPAAISSTR
jgi:hypothetical protein